jgi:hypothetical protein
MFVLLDQYCFGIIGFELHGETDQVQKVFGAPKKEGDLVTKRDGQ